MLEKQGANISCPPRSRRYNNSEGGDKNSLVLKRAFGFNRQQLEQNCFGTESWLELSRWPWLGPAGHRDRDCESDWLRFRLARPGPSRVISGSWVPVLFKLSTALAPNLSSIVASAKLELASHCSLTHRDCDGDSGPWPAGGVSLRKLLLNFRLAAVGPRAAEADHDGGGPKPGATASQILWPRAGPP